jgi:rRNA maturation protein Rpf1
MGLSELTALINQNGAKAAIIISIWKGNPGEMTILSPAGQEVINIRLESVDLRREVSSATPTRIARVEKVIVKSESNDRTKTFANDIASLLNLELSEQFTPSEALTEYNQSFIWLENDDSGKTLWTHYNAHNGLEIGPRILVSTIRRKRDE